MKYLTDRNQELFRAVVFGLGLACLGATLANAAPKYGPNATPLSKGSNLEYFQKNAAADFWALIPYYIPQPTVRACSATNLALVLNAARSAKGLTSADKLLTVDSLVKQYTEAKYEKAVLTDKPFDRSNVTNKNLARILRLATEKMKIVTDKTDVALVDVDLKNLDKSKQQFLATLKENEKSSNDFVIISFMQGTLTGDPEGGAHVATIGAYDEKKGLVLVLDPDREWYEPYWAPVEKVWDSVRDPKADGLNPGWIHFRAQ